MKYEYVEVLSVVLRQDEEDNFFYDIKLKVGEYQEFEISFTVVDDFEEVINMIDYIEKKARGDSDED